MKGMEMSAGSRLHCKRVLRYRCSGNLWRKGNPNASSHSATVALDRNANRRDGRRRQARHRRGPWQGATAQLCRVEAQSGRIVDEHWSASGRDRHVEERNLARRKGNQSLRREVSKPVEPIRYSVAKQRYNTTYEA